jgi:hypothetical protein
MSLQAGVAWTYLNCCMTAVLRYAVLLLTKQCTLSVLSFQAVL